MRLLLDTCTFLWILTDAPELSDRARELFEDPGNDVLLSSVSCWEISLKFLLGRLPLPLPPERYVPHQRDKHGIVALPLEEEPSLYLSRLPKIHNDPFDRMLICQSIVHGLSILTPDPHIRRYPVHTIW